ncbi:ankyrin repeat domain-containing protein [Rhabdochlamydiaceae symbiont of Dictyostelium giganteum]|uniref:ankyrin repeat domain-containing protein n=1 Tax=Rhabdochlamydiaceae symbiont of Dictyostelium giganteum TaxID=3342349 RepID=UPI00384A8004
MIFQKYINQAEGYLHLAVRHENPLALLIMSESEDVDLKNSLGQTSLHLAADLNNLSICQILINAGAEINCQDYSMKTPLHYACIKGIEGAKLLIECGADHSIMDCNQMNAIDMVKASASPWKESLIAFLTEYNFN